MYVSPEYTWHSNIGACVTTLTVCAGDLGALESHTKRLAQGIKTPLHLLAIWMRSLLSAEGMQACVSVSSTRFNEPRHKPLCMNDS